MLISSLALLAGLALLVWSSDKFIYGASGTASTLGVPPLLIGLTIVGFGTSAPEMLVSAVSSLNDNPGLAIGNAIGSNIANTALILGASALIAPLIVSSKILRNEMPLLIGVMVLSLVVMLNFELSRNNGIVLLVAMALVMSWIVYSGLKHPEDALQQDFDDEFSENIPILKSIGWLVLGLILLVASSRLMVWGAVNIAERLGVSDLIIGLSIVALGTSLPELAASIACMAKKEFDIALGNVLGSNIFNSLGVLGIAAIIKPSEVDSMVLYRDMPIQFALIFLIFYVCGPWGRGRISQFTGGFLICCYIAYQLLLFYQTT